MTFHTTIGPAARPTDTQLDFYARYRPHRALARPLQCTYCGEHCWVERGPPAMSNQRKQCIGCGGVPGVRVDLSP